jgi:hypothetical protein
MKVDFKTELKGHDGKPVGRMDEQLRTVLFSIDGGERLPLSADEKYLAYRIGKRLLEEGGKIELTLEEAAFLKRIGAVAFRAGAYGQLVDLLEGNK